MHDTQSTEFFFIVVATCALALQTVFMIVAVVLAFKAIRTARREMEEYRSAIMPVIEKTRDVVNKIAPKIESTANELSEILKSLRTQTADIQAAANDIIGRTRNQASRVDSMMTTVFDRVERAGVVVAETVVKPMRQFSGLIASVKAALEALRASETGRSRAPRPAPTPYSEWEGYPGPRSTNTTPQVRP